MLGALRTDVALDLEEYEVTGLRRLAVTVWRLMFVQRLQAVVLLRLAQAAGPRAVAAGVVLKWLNLAVTGCDIAWSASIGPGLRLYHPSGVVVGPDVAVGHRCTIMQHATLGHDRGGSPRLGDDVIIGPGACVLGPIEIGDGARVGANAVVTKSVPAGTLVYGNPAQIRGPGK